MEHALHPEANHHLPFFITPPGNTDVLFGVMGAIVLIVIVLLGSLYFTLHSLPERMAHRNNRTQLQLVAVLGLLALFTHNHALWLIGLLIALVQLPDFRTPTVSIAESLDRIARRLERRPPPDEPAAEPPPDEAEFVADAVADAQPKQLPPSEPPEVATTPRPAKVHST
jgi:hypothetical protein